VETCIEIGGEQVPVHVRSSSRARRISLRVARRQRAVELVVPKGLPLACGLAFLERQRDWLARRLAEIPSPVPFAHGVTIPFRGEPHLVVHVPQRRGNVWRETGPGASARLCVAGDVRHLPRRLTDWLKNAARRELLQACRHHAQAMGVSFRRLSVRDQTSRWGSCSASGTLSFSWRLVLAPPFVLDYLAAHEVAHLRHMNHSPAFWRLVHRHCPHAEAAEAWLKREGHTLFRWGAVK
jgi:hypothetical protein